MPISRLANGLKNKTDLDMLGPGAPKGRDVETRACPQSDLESKLQNSFYFKVKKIIIYN